MFRYFAIILVLSIAAFDWSIGLTALNPLKTSWLLQGGDKMGHLIGWLYYRKSEWEWPLTYFNSLIYPFGTTTVQMDSIPIAGLIFKLLDPWLPTEFQYFGPWLFLNFFLNGLYSFKIFRVLNVEKNWSLLGSFFLICSPVLLWRVGHIALASHWLILGVILEAFRFSKTGKINWVILGWYIFIALGIHAYLATMVFGLSVGLIVDELLRYRQIKRSLSVGLGELLIFISGVWFWGYAKVSSPAAAGFESFNADLLAPLNSLGSSSILSSLRSTPYAGESYCYLSLVAILGFGIWLYDKRKNQYSLVQYARTLKLQSFFIIAILFGIYAFGSPIRFGGNSLLSLDLAYKLLGPIPGIFRASGRFMWPMYYLVLIGLFTYFYRKINKPWIWVFVFGLFAFEMFPGYKNKFGLHNAEPMERRSLLIDELHVQKGQTVHLYPKFHEASVPECMPPDGFSSTEYGAIARQVALQGGKLTSGSTSRLPIEIGKTCASFYQRLLNEAKHNEIVIIHPNYFGRVEDLKLKSSSCTFVGHYMVCRL